MVSRYGNQHEKMLKFALSVRPGAGEPAFIVRIVSNYNGNGRLLQWGDVPLLDKSIHPDFKCYGEYAAYPLPKRHNGGRLLPPEEPKVEVGRTFLEGVLQSFRTGVIPEGTSEELLKLLAKLESPLVHKP